MKPTIGRIVHYFSSESELKTLHSHQQDQLLHQMVAGNPVRVDKPIPAIIVKVNDDGTVNLKLITDAPRNVWLTDVAERTAAGEPRRWAWPARE